MKHFEKSEHVARRSLSMLARFARYEFAALLSVVVLSAGVWGFVELADEVSEGDTQSIDETLLLSLRNPADHTDPLGPSWLQELAGCRVFDNVVRYSHHAAITGTTP
ncbi:hypothetical protein [Halomonas daqiaonensis]|uniref:Undecaprenyl-diphosphatase n=1 Tax=Halomonas daqiaonensis TaxID=650850 RepID=A0A1H7VGZ3_9GAMM|nr:hypothetical protein [Halomonas daqiaonensis]SEM08057.1 undecaprenyl-diphosphatase [Halomonas daqiaonensis]